MKPKNEPNHTTRNSRTKQAPAISVSRFAGPRPRFLSMPPTYGACGRLECGKGPRRCSSPGTHLVLSPPPGDLRPAAEVQLGQDVLHVVVDGSLGDDELVGDLPVRQPLGHHRRDLGLAMSQRAARPVPGV